LGKSKAIEKFLKSSLCAILVLLLLSQPCFAFVSQPIPPTLPQKINASVLTGPAEACFSLQRLSRPSVSGLHSKKILAPPTLRSETVPASNFLRAAQNQSSSPLKTQFSIKIERDASGSVLKLDLTNTGLRTFPIFIGFNPLRVFEPDFTGAQTHSFAYDAVGNRLTSDSVNYGANNLNQYSVVGAQNYSYDTNGNLTNDV
jgi:hypothetical protein